MEKLAGGGVDMIKPVKIQCKGQHHQLHRHQAGQPQFFQVTFLFTLVGRFMLIGLKG